MAIEPLDDEDYANLLYHAAEDQLYRKQKLEEFVIKHSSTILELVLHLFTSDELPDKIHHEELELTIRTVKDKIYSCFSEIGTDALPYHDDVLYVQYFLDMHRSFTSSAKAPGARVPDPVKPWKGQDEEVTKYVKEMLSIYPDFGFSQELSKTFHFFSKYLYFPAAGTLLWRFLLAIAKAGYKIRKLDHLEGTFHANTILPPENGYTRAFQTNETVTKEQLRDELLTRNVSAEPERLSFPEEMCITVAVSYKHYVDGSKDKICPRDVDAIHRFLIASQPSVVRFWIDSKLPATNDSSFDRWLKRGVRPYARYFTLVCPSAFEDTERYWIQMERLIAMPSNGIFYVTQDGIYFKKNPFYYRKLCRKMLTMMVGRDGIPPGMRTQDEGKVVQWALGFLGDKDSVKLFQVRGPRVYTLCNREFREFTVMRNITYLIKEHGELELPVEPGRTWNKDNPLILRGIPDQVLLLPTWIGFARYDEPRKVCFLNGSTLTQVVHGAVVGLEVTLRNAFKKGEKNEVVRKVLRDIPQTDLVELKVFENGEEMDFRRRFDLPCAAIQQALLKHLKRGLEAVFFANSGEDEERRSALRFFLEQVSRRREEPSYEGTEENRERSEEPKDEAKLTYQLIGMQAITFAWECDWD